MPQKSEGLIYTATGTSIKVMLMMQVKMFENRNCRKSGMRWVDNKLWGSNVVPSRVHWRAFIYRNFVLQFLGCLFHVYINFVASIYLRSVLEQQIYLFFLYEV